MQIKRLEANSELVGHWMCASGVLVTIGALGMLGVIEGHTAAVLTLGSSSAMISDTLRLNALSKKVKLASTALAMATIVLGVLTIQGEMSPAILGQILIPSYSFHMIMMGILLLKIEKKKNEVTSTLNIFPKSFFQGGET